jgi:hypothetical protein
MKRQIAMRCTQEQFESIKDRIPKPNDSDFDLIKYPYLTNYYNNNSDEVTIGSIKLIYADKEEIHETFNADIFLEACGEEVEKVWDASEMQYSIGYEWFDFLETVKIRLKPQPDYSQEIEALQQKAKENGMKAVITFEKL